MYPIVYTWAQCTYIAIAYREYFKAQTIIIYYLGIWTLRVIPHNKEYTIIPVV